MESEQVLNNRLDIVRGLNEFAMSCIGPWISSEAVLNEEQYNYEFVMITNSYEVGLMWYYFEDAHKSS